LRTLRLGLVAVAAAATLAIPASSLGTTLPTKTVLGEVLITDQRMIVAQYQGE